MVQVFLLIDRLRNSGEFDYELLSEVENEARRLLQFVPAHSQTAQLLQQDIEWQQLSITAMKEYKKYRAGVYQIISVLAKTMDKTLQRWYRRFVLTTKSFDDANTSLCPRV